MTDLQFGYFDRFTPHYGEERLRFALDEISADARSGASVLDVGCGDGAVLAFLRDQGVDAQFVGVDPAPSYVEQATERGLDASVGSVLDWAMVDAQEGRHDYVVMASVLHHLVDPKRFSTSRLLAGTALRNCLAMLKPGGKLFVFEPCSSPRLFNRMVFRVKRTTIGLGGNRRIGRGWVNFGAPLVAFFTPDELEETINASGGRVIRTVEVDRQPLIPGVAARMRVGMVIQRADAPAA